ncbi:MAG: aquaporin [Propionivibrio sp.]|nr:aquaporin [Propionivibrio sp.]
MAEIRSALRQHWPEYLIEGWALGSFMVSAGIFTTLFEYPGSPLRHAFDNADARRVMIGMAMGLTAIALIYSPWGQRSGAHMNPAVTLTFLRLKKIARCDAAMYIAAQFIGGTLGVLLVMAVCQGAFTEAPVSYVTTVPGPQGALLAFIAEFAISALLMAMVLLVSNSQRHGKYTGLGAGLMVAVYIALEAPLSGMSMNPARSFASAWPADVWTGFWIYLTAPVFGMQCAAAWYVRPRCGHEAGCAKLLHSKTQRCIHCGYVPPLP